MDTGTLNLYNPDLETTNYGQVFQKILRKDGFAANIIENYNHEVKVKLKEAIEKTPIITNHGEVRFTNVRFEKPKYEVGGISDRPLLPRVAREKIIPYVATIKADIVYLPSPDLIIDDKQIFNKTRDIEPLKDETIGYIPVMLGSELCHLYGKTPAEKLAMGECFNDPLGYFIIQSERTINNQEILRRSTFLIYNEVVKGGNETIVGKITIPTVLGTTQNKIIINSYSALMVYLTHLDNKKYMSDEKGKGKEPPYPPLYAVLR